MTETMIYQDTDNQILSRTEADEAAEKNADAVAENDGWKGEYARAARSGAVEKGAESMARVISIAVDAHEPLGVDSTEEVLDLIGRKQ